MSMAWVRNNIAVLTAAVALVLWCVGAAVHVFVVKAEMEHGLRDAAAGRDQLHKVDTRIEKRVAHVGTSQQKQNEQLARIETRQQAIQDTAKATNKQIERLDSKMDQLLRR